MARFLIQQIESFGSLSSSLQQEQQDSYVLDKHRPHLITLGDLFQQRTYVRVHVVRSTMFWHRVTKSAIGCRVPRLLSYRTLLA